MFLYPPKEFDINEWFVIIGVITNILVIAKLPARLPKPVTPLILLLSIAFPKIVDHSIGVDPYNLYDLMDLPKYEIFDLALYGVYPLFGYLFIYFYEYFKLSQLKLIVYMLAWSFFAVIFEYLLLKMNIFTYIGWKLIYSLPLYIITLSLTLGFYLYTCKYLEKHPCAEKKEAGGA